MITNPNPTIPEVLHEIITQCDTRTSRSSIRKLHEKEDRLAFALGRQRARKLSHSHHTSNEIIPPVQTNPSIVVIFLNADYLCPRYGRASLLPMQIQYHYEYQDYQKMDPTNSQTRDTSIQTTIQITTSAAEITTYIRMQYTGPSSTAQPATLGPIIHTNYTNPRPGAIPKTPNLIQPHKQLSNTAIPSYTPRRTHGSTR